MSSTPLVTYSDILEHLLRVEGSTNDARTKALAKRAILSAYAEFPNFKRWKYYYTRDRVTTDASYSTGTVTYDHADGSVERELTLASGTWPTNAARGKVRINNVEYSVATRESGTIVSLSINLNPGEDITTATSFEWWRDVYPMPLDFSGADQLIDHDNSWQPDHVSPGTVLNSRANRIQSNEPRLYSFFSDPDYVGAMAVIFEPPPNNKYNFDFMYTRNPLPFRTPDYSTGTVSVSSTTVTGTGTAWTSRMVGTVHRFPESGVDQIPTGLDGMYPFAEERVVSAVASATSLTIDDTLDGTYSGVKYRISDFIDLDYAVMSEVFLKFCEFKFAGNLKSSDQKYREKDFIQSLQIAKSKDGSRNFANISPMPVQYFNRLRHGTESGDSE